MTDLATIGDADRRCILCPHLRRKSEPRFFARRQACEPCRVRLPQLLVEIQGAYVLLPASLERGIGAGQRISGGEVESPLPFREDVWDLLLPVRTARVVGALRDQVGYVSVATTLDSWARDWADIRNRGEAGPAGSVAEATAWLGNRVQWACDDHPAVDEFVVEMLELLWAMRPFVPREKARPQPCVGVPCRRCDLKTLARLSDGSGEIECQNSECRTIYRPDEYDRWVKLVSASLKG